MTSPPDPHTPITAVETLKTRVPEAVWRADDDVVNPRLTDWRGRYHGHAPVLARPRDTAEMARLIAICAELSLPITPQGGNTGLVGGATPFGEILVSTERLSAIRALDPHGGAIIAEAGVTLHAVQEAADEAGLYFPLSLGSQGTATIGGLISTNAGGVGVIRYGMMRDMVLGLEAVLPDGRIWDGLRTVRKDNTGYDLKQLLIGAEGSLGVITAAALRLFPKPKARLTALCAMTSPADAIGLLSLVRAALGDAVTAFELMARITLDLTTQHVPDIQDPFCDPHHWYVLVEASVFAGSDAISDAFEGVLNHALEAGVIADAALARNLAQAHAFWRIRETIPEAEKRDGPAIKHDVSAPIAALPHFLDQAANAARSIVPNARIIAFGHVGDGNIHFNVAAPEGMTPQALLAHSDAVNTAVYDVVDAFHGSIAAEHGVGVLKREALAARRAPVELDVMRAIKTALDPQNIMNPRVLFPPSPT